MDWIGIDNAMAEWLFRFIGLLVLVELKSKQAYRTADCQLSPIGTLHIIASSRGLLLSFDVERKEAEKHALASSPSAANHYRRVHRDRHRASCG
jgi:hypothetical protein